MFSGTTFDSVGFSSAIKDVKSSADANLQTSELQVKDKGDQSNDLQDKSEQVGPSIISLKADYDENKLLIFLNKVTGSLFRELDKIEISKAFTSQKFEAASSDTKVKELYVLSDHTQQETFSFRVSCLAWSCSGNVVAIGFECTSHKGWCTHESEVKFYNISTFKFDGGVATHTVKTDSCVTGIAAHPYEASVIALATYSGNVEIWSVGKEGRSDGVCMSKEQYHEDKITQLSWASDSSQQLILVTSSLDGRMCILKNLSVGTTQLVDKYVLETESPDVLKPGITCFSFCPQQSGSFVAALENNQILLCSTFCSKSNNASVIERSPVLRPLHKIAGPISYIKFSPHEDYVFLVATLDFKITLYSIQQDNPIKEILCDYNIIGADWSPVQSTIIIAWCNSPRLLVFNQKSGEKICELMADDKLGTSDSRYYCKALFNVKSPQLLALAGPAEKSYVWSIPTSF